MLTIILSNITVDDTSGCWLWFGKRRESGHASLPYRPGNGHDLRHAYQVAFELFRYEIPTDPASGRLMDLDHIVCDNGQGGCVNPWHVEPTTREVNTSRSASANAMKGAIATTWGKANAMKGAIARWGIAA